MNFPVIATANRAKLVSILSVLTVAWCLTVCGSSLYAQKVIGYIDPDDPTGANRLFQSAKLEISESDLSSDPLDKFLEDETAKYAEIRGIYFSALTGAEKKKALSRVDDLVNRYERATFTPRGLPRILAIVLGREKKISEELAPMKEKIADLGVSDALKRILSAKVQERTASIASERKSAAESLARLHVVQKIRRSGNQLRKEQEVLADVGSTAVEMQELASAFFNEAEKEGRENAQASLADGFEDILARYSEQQARLAKAQERLPPSSKAASPAEVESGDTNAKRAEIVQAFRAQLASTANSIQPPPPHIISTREPEVDRRSGSIQSSVVGLNRKPVESDKIDPPQVLCKRPAGDPLS